MKLPASGRCQCGNVCYRIVAEPLVTVACHCQDCQKLSTSAFSITMVLNRNAVEFDGELKCWERVADSGNTVACWFCPTCGNRIYHDNPAAPDFIRLKPCTLDDTSVLDPIAHIWACREQPWLGRIGELHKVDGQPDFGAVMAALSRGEAPF